MATPIKTPSKKKKKFPTYTSFGPQSPSTKRTAPSYTINSETLIPTSRFKLGSQLAKTPGPDYEKAKAMGKQVESQKNSSSAVVVEKTSRDCLQKEYKSYVGPGRYKGARISSLGKQFDSKKKSHRGVKWGSPEKTVVNRKKILEEYKQMFRPADDDDLLYN